MRLKPIGLRPEVLLDWATRLRAAMRYKDPRDAELRALAEARGFSFDERRASSMSGGSTPVDAALLPRHGAGCHRLLQGFWNGRRTYLFDAFSKKLPGPAVWMWLLDGSEDSNPSDYFFTYSCAATAVDAPLPNCAVLGSSADDWYFGPKRYGLKQTTPIAGCDGWLTATTEGSAPPRLPDALEECLPTIPAGWHFRLSPPWLICVAGWPTDHSAYDRNSDLDRLLELTAELAERIERPA